MGAGLDRWSGESRISCVLSLWCGLSSQNELKYGKSHFPRVSEKEVSMTQLRCSKGINIKIPQTQRRAWWCQKQVGWGVAKGKEGQVDGDGRRRFVEGTQCNVQSTCHRIGPLKPTRPH